MIQTQLQKLTYRVAHLQRQMAIASEALQKAKDREAEASMELNHYRAMQKFKRQSLMALALEHSPQGSSNPPPLNKS